ncbi:MAG TPA: ribbon-helix-helix domain-containing protein [Myxococcaceae bacterium]|jgi:hypothetical protein|nr:ribbon-helix-helix domain-containing protein [Myxococcaceae bacterium]
MPDSSALTEAATDAGVAEKDDTVSTHVLVTEEDVRRLRALSRRTRIAQSEYLREAVDDLLRKYDAAPKED